MRWQGDQESGNVEDRRGVPMGGIAAGGGVVATLVVIVFALLTHQSPTALLQTLQQSPSASVAPRSGGQVDPAQEPLRRFAAVVLKDTEIVWSEQFPRSFGKSYQPTTMVLFTGQTQSECGGADSASGPFYCPADKKVYLDLEFFNELKTRFKVEGDFACAYVIAHEVGHHVQDLLGISARMQRMRETMDPAEYNQQSVRLELQADYLAGVWAFYADKSKHILESGDLESALTAANAIGDDTLQKQARGRVVPDSFTHGTSAQRVRWFNKGFTTGNVSGMDELFKLDYRKL